jgi:hypothetical protein
MVPGPSIHSLSSGSNQWSCPFLAQRLSADAGFAGTTSPKLQTIPTIAKDVVFLMSFNFFSFYIGCKSIELQSSKVKISAM